MPSWAALTEEKRWHVVSYLRSAKGAVPAPVQKSAEQSPAAPIATPAPTPPFTDFRYEEPGKQRKISVNDLPQPYATASAGNGPKIVARPASVLPKAPAGFSSFSTPGRDSDEFASTRRVIHADHGVPRLTLRRERYW